MADHSPVSSRDQEFYLTSEMRIFKVEDRLYRVHPSPFTKHSSIFRDMFSLLLPAKSLAGEEGSSDENPIFLAHVTVLEFESLLQFFHNGMFRGFELSVQSWAALFSIAHRFDFTDIMDEASHRILVLDPVEQLVIAERYNLPREMFAVAFNGLVARTEALSEEELTKMHVSLVHRFIVARDESFRRRLAFKGSRF